jgi:hypothetical protein
MKLDLLYLNIHYILQMDELCNSQYSYAIQPVDE